MGLVSRFAIVFTFALTGCAGSTTDSTDTTDGEIGPVLYVTRPRAEVRDHDDFFSLTLEIERTTLQDTACVLLHRETPEGQKHTFMALLPGPPDEIGEDFFTIDGITARTGDRLTGKSELGSAERPPEIAQAYQTATTQLREACEPSNLEERFDRVFETIPIVYINEIEAAP